MGLDRPTLVKLARELGVSATTVSNAFRRPDQLSAELRERILARAHAVGFYGPDPRGQLLRTGRSNMVGLALFDGLEQALGDSHGVDLVRGVAAVLDKHHLGLVVLPEFGRDVAAGDALPFPVDGLIVQSPDFDDDVVASLRARRVPLIMVDALHEGVSSVTIDDRAAARSAAEHVLDLGHRRIGVLSFHLDEAHRDALLGDARPAEPPGYALGTERLLGYRDALEAAGLPFSSVAVRECENDEGAARAETLALLADEQPTALLCMTDRMAMGACGAAAALDLRVPDDVSVVGFDDAAEAGRHEPPLTTVRQNGFEKGRLAAELLLSQQEVVSTRLGTELVVRASTGPAN